jgi:hypothetical protein
LNNKNIIKTPLLTWVKVEIFCRLAKEKFEGLLFTNSSIGLLAIDHVSTAHIEDQNRTLKKENKPREYRQKGIGESKLN